MAKVDMDLAELDQMRETIKNQSKTIDDLKALCESNKKSVYVEHKYFKASVNRDVILDDVNEYQRTHYGNVRREVVELLVNIDLNKAISVEGINKTTTSFIGLDEVSDQIRESIKDIYNTKISNLEKENKDLRFRLRDSDDVILKQKLFTDTEVRSKTLDILEKNQKERLEAETAYHKDKASLENKISFLEIEIEKAKESPIKQEVANLAKRVSELTWERDEVKNKWVAMLSRIEKYNNKSIFGKMFSAIDVDKHLL